jgi:hypothetical protein
MSVVNYTNGGSAANALANAARPYGLTPSDRLQTEQLPMSVLANLLTGNLNNVFDVRAFGATGNGVTDDTAAIQAALDACNAAGGGVVFLPAGTYLVSARVEPAATVTAFCLRTYSNVTMKGAGTAATTIKQAAYGTPSGAAVNWLLLGIMTEDPFNQAAPKYNVAFEDFTYDGQAVLNNDVPPSGAHGIYVGATRGAWHTRVVVKNIYGTSPTPPDETFCFSAEESADVHYTDCEAFGDDGGDTSTGFSVGSSTGVTYTGCVAHDLTFGMGFTTFYSAGVTYAACRAYLCGENGFNSEVSVDVTYSACQSGGAASDVATNAFFTQNESLGNGASGFLLLGGERVAILSCTSSFNAEYGFRANTYTPSTPDVVCDQIIVAGCVITNNTTKGILIDSGQVDIILAPSNIVLDNGASSADDYSVLGSAPNDTLRAARAPKDIYSSLDSSSGMQWQVLNSVAATRFRWLGGSGNELMRIAGDGALGLQDGITAPSTISGVALLYVDTADGDLKVKFGDGTVKTIVTDT